MKAYVCSPEIDYSSLIDKCHRLIEEAENIDIHPKLILHPDELRALHYYYQLHPVPETKNMKQTLFGCPIITSTLVNTPLLI